MATQTTKSNTRAASQTRAATEAATLRGAWWKWGMGLIMAYVIYGAFFIAEGAAGFGQSGDKARVVFFHVPCAVLSSVCYFVGMWYAVKYLIGVARNDRPDDARRPVESPMTSPFLRIKETVIGVTSRFFGSPNSHVDKTDATRRHSDSLLATDFKSAVAMELGALFCLLATITGSLFAGLQWGSYWNWDPRETSIVIMLLLYASYLVLRGALAGQWEKRARLSAVYAVIALVPAQFLIWVVPRITSGLHPTNTLFGMDKTSYHYKIVLYPAFLAFTLLFVWLFQLRLRSLLVMARRQGQEIV